MSVVDSCAKYVMDGVVFIVPSLDCHPSFSLSVKNITIVDMDVTSGLLFESFE